MNLNTNHKLTYTATGVEKYIYYVNLIHPTFEPALPNHYYFREIVETYDNTIAEIKSGSHFWFYLFHVDFNQN